MEQRLIFLTEEVIEKINEGLKKAKKTNESVTVSIKGSLIEFEIMP